MAEEPTNLIFEYLRRIDSRLDGIEGKLDMRVARVSSLENQVAHMRTDIVRLEHRMDHFDQRLVRIERRLGLVEA